MLVVKESSLILIYATAFKSELVMSNAESADDLP